MTVTPHGDVTAPVTEHGQAPAGFVGKQYSLARESREGAEQVRVCALRLLLLMCFIIYICSKS